MKLRRILLIGVFVLLMVFAYQNILMLTYGILNTFFYKFSMVSIGVIALIYIIVHLESLKSSSKLTYLILWWTVAVSLSNVNFISGDVEYIFSQILPFTLFCPLVYLFFYTYIKNNPNDMSLCVSLFAISLAFLGPIFFVSIRFINSNVAQDFASIRHSYYLLLLLPWFLLVKTKLIRVAGITIILFIIALSMKRAGMVALLFGLLSYFIVSNRTINGWRERLGLLFFFSFIAVSFFIILKYVNNISQGYLLDRFSSAFTDRGSNRLDIYEKMFQLQKDSSFLYWIFGHGHTRTMDQLGLFSTAHNDWLEVLFDYGIISLLLYTLIHIRLLLDVRILYLRGSFAAAPLFASYSMFFVLSLFSHLIIYPDTFMYLMAFWGAINALEL